MINIQDTMLSDMFKDVNGFRPRGYYKEWWTESELEAEYAHLEAIIKENMAEEEIQQAAALVGFEKLIDETIELGAADRDTAIRWLMQAEDVDVRFFQDVEGFFWGQGLSWDKINEFTKLFHVKSN